MDESDPQNHCVLGMAYFYMGNHEKAVATLQHAVEIDPNSATALHWLATCLTKPESAQEVIALMEKAIRVNPLDKKFLAMCAHRLGRTYGLLGKYKKAAEEYEKSLRIRPNRWGTLLWLTAVYVHLGREKDARATAREVMRLNPSFLLEDFEKRVPYTDQAMKENDFRAWRKAGLK